MSAPVARESLPVTVIDPLKGASWPDWRELWAHRELIYLLARRDVAIRYKQSVIGVLWSVVQPLLLATRRVHAIAAPFPLDNAIACRPGATNAGHGRQERVLEPVVRFTLYRRQERQ